MATGDDQPWIGRYRAAPPPRDGFHDPTRALEIELKADSTFTFVEHVDLAFKIVRGEWVLSTSERASESETFDFVTLIPKEGDGILGFFGPCTFRVGEFGIADTSSIPTASGWHR